MIAYVMNERSGVRVRFARLIREAAKLIPQDF
jgi:hypothetical protein